MASFRLKNRRTEIEYTVKATEFVFRNTYGFNANNRQITSLEPTGYTSITAIGDNILQKLGLDDILNGDEYYFVNQPNYYIKMRTNSTTTYVRYPDGSVYNSDLPEYNYLINFIKHYVPLGLYNGTTWIGDLITTYYWTWEKVYAGQNTPLTLLDNILPNFLEAFQPVYNPTIAINVSQGFIAEISPYYYQMQTFAASLESFSFSSNQERKRGRCQPIYYGQPFTVRNSLNGVSSSYGLYKKGQNNVIGIYENTVKKYGDLSGGQYECAIIPYGTSPNNNSPLFMQRYGAVGGRSWYDIIYSLLFDTDTTDTPYPDNDSDDSSGGTGSGSGQSKPNTGGNPTGGDKSTTDIIVPSLPTVTPVSTGSVNLYQMDNNTFKSLMQYLWNDTFFNAIVKLFQDPMQAVISAHIIGCPVVTSGTSAITIGNVTTDITANVVGNNFISAVFNYITIPEFYKDSSDFTETVIELYLPYYGYVTLNPYEVMGANVYLQYIIDVLTGDFIAFVTIQKSTDGTNLNSVLYQYHGNMIYQIPLSSIDFSDIITSSIGIAGSLLAKNAIGVINSSMDLLNREYDRASHLSGNNGYMAIKQAYVAISRPIHHLPPNFSKYVGYPYIGYVNLGSCTGLTICTDVYIINTIGSSAETEQIRQLLKEGVIF